MLLRSALSSLLAALATAACGAPAERATIPVTLLSAADATASVKRSLGASDLPIELRYAPLPNRAPAVSSENATQAAIAKARAHYINAEFGKCLGAITADTAELLGRNQRMLAARALFWQIACRAGAGDASGAARLATAYATFGFEIAGDADAVAPDVERLMTDALEAGERAPRHRLSVAANALRARVSIDGRPAGCVVPCTVDLPSGDHVVRIDADGYEPRSRIARISTSAIAVRLEAVPAPPALAARQWSARYGGAGELDGDSSMALLANAVRARNLVLVSTGAANKQRGVLAIGGRVVARAERAETSIAAAAPSLLRELLVRGKLTEPAPPLYRRYPFWISVGAAAVAAGMVATLLLYEPPDRQVVSF